MNSKKERVLRFLIAKENIETIFTSLGAVIVGGALFGITLGAAAHGRIIFSIVCFFAFCFFMALVLAHAALYIALPMEKAMQGPYPASEPSPPKGLKEIVRAPIGAIFTIPGVFYMVVMIGFFLFTQQLVKLLAINLNVGS